MHALKKSIYFCLFDWANSPFATIVITFVFAEYFVKAIAHNSIEGTALWGWMISISAILVAILGPPLGVLADKKNYSNLLLWFTTITICLCSNLLWFVYPKHDLLNILQLLILVGIANTAFELGMIFYNAKLNFFTKKEKLGSLSGKAWASGYFGGIACLLLVLFCFILPDDPIFNIQKQYSANIRICGPVVGIWIMIFALPFLLIKYPNPPFQSDIKILKELKLLILNIISLFKNPKIGRFLISRMLYTDGLNTLFAFGGIYAAGTFNLKFKEIIFFGIGINITAAIGSLLLGYLDDKIGSKKIIIISLIFLIILSILILVIDDILYFWILGLSLGFFIGSVQSSSRSLMINLSNPKRINEMFGLYALSGKATAFIGPLLVATVTTITQNQRYGMSTILIFLISGLVLLLMTKNK